MTRAVHIVAVGARTPLGLSAESSAAAVRARLSALGDHPFMVDAAGDPLRCGCDRLLDPKLIGAPRLAALASHALAQVAAKLTSQTGYPEVVPVLLALPEARPGFAESDADEVARALGAAELPGELAVEVAASMSGHAGALYALDLAAARVAQRQSELCIAGGVDSYFDADTLDWLESERRVARTDIRSGFPPGEGAGMLAVASDAARARLGLPSLARIRGVGSAQETRSAASDTGLLGEGLTTAVLAAAQTLRPPEELVTDLYGDINGERPRTDDWGFALLRTHQLYRGTSYIAAVGEWGDVGAAWGALGCNLAIQAWQRRYAKGSRAMVWAGSWGGLRAAAVLEQGAG